MADDPEDEVEETEEPEEEEPEDVEEPEEEDIVTVPTERRSRASGWVVGLIVVIVAAFLVWYYGVKKPADERAAKQEKAEKALEAGALVKDAHGELNAALDSIAAGDVKAALGNLDGAKAQANKAVLKARDAEDAQAQQAYETLVTHIEETITALSEKSSAVEAQRKELQAAEKELKDLAQEKVQSLVTEAKGKATLHMGGAGGAGD